MKINPIIFLLLSFFLSCSYTVPEGSKTGQLPDIFPDYAGVTIPANVAPLNFRLKQPCEEAYAVLQGSGNDITVKAKKGEFRIPPSAWKKLAEAAKGKAITVAVTACGPEGKWETFEPFNLYVAEEEMDPYIAYRLIEPGYQLWNKMGLYQRNLESYKQSPIIESRFTGENCMNCHSFCMQDPGRMLFHMRDKYPGTYMIRDGKIEKLNTKTEQTISALVYPSWHPTGKYVAFSVNNTKQGFHLNDANRVEVYDEASDVVVYDVEKHEIVTAPQLFSKKAYETFPTFSPDGKTLYFCSADSLLMPESFDSLRYSLCSISFNPETRGFGSEVDTLYNARRGMSASFPRVSPDGKFLLYTLSGYGNFSIWHKDADLYMADLSTKESRRMDELNTGDVESYHSWSSNSRWVVFSSRRIDGLYTRPYFAHIGADGKAGKPFLLPQKDATFYDRFMKSYNIPEFIKGKVKDNRRLLQDKAINDAGIDVRFSGK